MEIYLDANATTPVLPAARDAALAAMSLDFGNPSSSHSCGLRARFLKENVRAQARRILGLDAETGQLLFVSGATEAIQTAILSALISLRAVQTPGLLLYGATEHKAVPEALAHWNAVLGLNWEIRAIPVGHDGRHDLAWLRQHAPLAGLVCTMAANNETGVISDLQGIADAIRPGNALWMVDGVQALGKLPLRLQDLPIDYAPFSGHKLYAPKGIGMLYVRDGAPYTPLIVGGGQESASRSGTENMSGIAALGAIFSAIESGTDFQDAATLDDHRSALMTALRDAFTGVVFNAPLESSLPTTINFSVPGIGSKVLLNLFDAAGVRVSSGSACGAAKARPSYVLEAMGLPDWQVESAIRMSFGPADTAAFIAEACTRIRACGDSLRQNAPHLLPMHEGGLASTVVEGERHSVLSNIPGPHSATAAAIDGTGICGRDDASTCNHDTNGDTAGISSKSVEISMSEVIAMARENNEMLLVDVREIYEQRLGVPPDLGGNVSHLMAPLSQLPELLPELLSRHSGRPFIFLCRSGNRSEQAARMLRHVGHASAWSLAGGLALWSMHKAIGTRFGSEEEAEMHDLIAIRSRTIFQV